ncbi:MAG: DUF2550 domain-containing protein [Marmoricola sp.]
MTVWQWLADWAALLIGVPFCYGVLLVVRRRWIQRSGGTFELSWRRRSGADGRGWVLGIGRYSHDELQWFRIFSPSPRPRETLRRDNLRYLGVRVPGPDEAAALYPDNVVVRCAAEAREFEISMSSRALVGFQAWLEAAPPADPALRSR